MTAVTFDGHASKSAAIIFFWQWIQSQTDMVMIAIMLRASEQPVENKVYLIEAGGN